jgi:tryptophan 2,3-dioxygenase
VQSLTYSEYLSLDQLLSAQNPRSEEHDELLFIVVHQVYELWFKQLLHELDGLRAALGAAEDTTALAVLKRVLSILKVAVAQVDVLETMTPLQFAGFRARLESASGFQSAQFRRLEAVLGRRDHGALDRYPEGSTERISIVEEFGRPSLWDAYLSYLGHRGWPLGEAGTVAMGTLVEVYRSGGPEMQIAERLVDLDEGLQEWRYRHAVMVMRTIGDKPGTGGSSGAGYLRSTLFSPVFPLLWEVRRLM